MAGRDLDGNGKFDLLTIQREVYVAAPGHYQWQADLGDGSDRKLGVYIGGGQLTPGMNQLFFEFSGRAICVDGPYHLSLFALGNRTSSLYEGPPLTTEAFPATAFEGGGCAEETIDGLGALSFLDGLPSGHFAAPFKVLLAGVDGSYNGSSIPVTVSLAAAPAGAVLRAKTTRWTSRGIAVFDVRPSKPFAGYVLRATSPGLAPVQTPRFAYRP